MTHRLETARLWLLAAAFTIFAPVYALAAAGEEPPAPPTPAEEIQAVIEGQLRAFQVGDGPGAFFYAAPTIQAMFGGPEPFMMMVEQSFNVVFTNQSFVFGQTLVDGGRAMQEVLVEDGTGQSVALAYFLGRRGSEWKIEAVQPIRGGPNA